MPSSATLLSRIPRRLAPGTQALTPAYLDLLAKLGSPQRKLPPVFHVAGTNGKGSTCAFLRSLLEAAGYKVHVYTSPHLVHFHERIRIAGQLISEEELVGILTECERADTSEQVSEFEVLTAAAFLAFARHFADFTILEVGLGGRLDATNVVDKPLATLISRLSYDHREYLGNTLEEIAREKAGIMRPHVPCFVSGQAELESIDALREVAAKTNTPLFVGGDAWHVRPTDSGFHFEDKQRSFDLPSPALVGTHQYVNAGLAIAALSVLEKPLTVEAISEGLKKVEWPARLQRLSKGALIKILAQNQELWLDGGHNDSAGEVLAVQAENWAQQDGPHSKPLFLIVGMLTTKNPREFLATLGPHVTGMRTITIPGEAMSFSADALLQKVQECGIQNVRASTSIQKALSELATLVPNARILICGSLYLAGHVLRANDA